MDTGIRVGHESSENTIEQATESILGILAASGDRDVLLKALDTLGKITSISQVTISNNTFGTPVPYSSFEPHDVTCDCEECEDVSSD